MVTTDTRSNNEEITTREGFELPEMPNFMRAWNPITVNQVHAYGQQCYQAAKADELAFLEGLLDTYNDECWDAHDAIEIMGSSINNRIAHLKGESRE